MPFFVKNLPLLILITACQWHDEIPANELQTASSRASLCTAFAVGDDGKMTLNNTALEGFRNEYLARDQDLMRDIADKWVRKSGPGEFLISYTNKDHYNQFEARYGFDQNEKLDFIAFESTYRESTAGIQYFASDAALNQLHNIVKNYFKFIHKKQPFFL